ncbi:MAG: bile acid:sodium symporter family protein [Bacteroidales bacterium]|nr:bile acid:sodium symporter family protein [Bacteroidales bacterium]
MKILQQISAWLSRYTSIFIILIAILTLIVPDIFSWVRGYTQVAILGFIMLTMGLTLTISDLKILVQRPFDILLGTISQFTIMPLVAYTLTRIFNLDASLSIGIILVGCCPGGVSSNIMSFLCKGDVAFSVGMTTVSTLIAPFATPFLVLMLADKSVDVDAVGMFLNILIVTIIPVFIGFVLNMKIGTNSSFQQVRNVMPGFSVVGLACIVGGVVSSVHCTLMEHGLMLFLLTFAVVFCHNTTGYILGYIVAHIAKFNIAKSRTLSIEIGMQNAGLATSLAATFFMATNPLSIVPCAISCAWHSISGTILAGLFCRIDDHKTNKNA